MSDKNEIKSIIYAGAVILVPMIIFIVIVVIKNL